MTCCRFIRLTINLCPNCSLGKPYTSEHDKHLLKYVWNFAARGDHISLWPEANPFLSHRGSYLRSESVKVTCGRKCHGLIGPTMYITMLDTMSRCPDF